MAEIPFPQADDFDKIIRIVNISDEVKLMDFELMGAYLDGITDRQVSYYLSAAMYLGILDKNKKFTSLGNEIRKLNNYSRIIELIRILIADEVIGKIYISQKVLGVQYEKEDVAELIKEKYTQYSEPIYMRRAQTVLCWLEWIDKQFA